MSRRLSWRGMAIGVAVLALGIVVAVILFGQGPGQDVHDESSLTAEERDAASGDAPAGGGDTAATTSPLVATNDAGEIIPPKPTTKKPATSATPASPASPTNPTTPATPATPGGLTPEEQAYLEETKKVVEENAGDLADVVRIITEALSDGDKGTLGSMLAGGEGGAFADELAEKYPQFLETSSGGNVNIFATSDTTVYFAYVLVTWEDGGIVSQHTIPVPLRFVDGEWRLTSLGDTSPDLQFVQSVAL